MPIKEWGFKPKVITKDKEVYYIIMYELIY